MAQTKFKFNKDKHLIPALVVLLIGAAFYIGQISAENKYLSRGGSPLVPGEAFAPDIDESAQAKDVERPSGDDHIRGNTDAEIALIEYSDYECPFCGQFHPSAQQLMEEMGDSVMWVYRHFPLDQIHPNARPAALAAECVAKLAGEDAFWSFTDTVFENQDLLSLTQIRDWALAEGVNAVAYDSCIESPDTASRIEADVQSGSLAGVNGTPGNIVINLETGEAVVLPGAVPYAQVKAAVESLQ